MPAVDLSEVIELERYAIREIDRTYDHLIAVTEKQIAKEKRGHPYTNRTHNTERTTVATVHGATDDGGVCTMQMGTDYSSYLAQKGYSLIDRVADEAARQHQEYLEELAEDIAGQ